MIRTELESRLQNLEKGKTRILFRSGLVRLLENLTGNEREKLINVLPIIAKLALDISQTKPYLGKLALDINQTKPYLGKLALVMNQTKPYLGKLALNIN